MVVRTERMLRDCLQVSVNMGIIMHGYQQPYVTSGFMAFLYLFLSVWCCWAVFSAQHTHCRKGNLFNYNLPLASQIKISIWYEYPKQITLWLLLMKISSFIFFKVSPNVQPNTVYIWLRFEQHDYFPPEGSCVPEELFRLSSLSSTISILSLFHKHCRE